MSSSSSSSSSCTTLTIEEDPRYFSLSIFKFPKISLSHLVSLVGKNPRVSIWRELPLTERLEVAESLLATPMGDTDELFFNCISILVMFIDSVDLRTSSIARQIVVEALNLLLYLVPLEAVSTRDEINDLREKLCLSSKLHAQVRWIPPLVLISFGLAACLILGPRLSGAY
jgi:hypothetical protein